MTTGRAFRATVLAGACVVAGAACNGDNGSGVHSSPYAVRFLVSNGAVPADHVDANLVNPWGIAFNPSGPVWVANNGTNTSTLYDGTGEAFPNDALPFVFHVPAGSRGAAHPTGIVFNNTPDFGVSGTGLGAPASFLFSGEGGTIAAWTTTSLLDAVTMYDDGSGGAVYKGLARATNGTENFLYATDFHNGKIDVFDKNFMKTAAPGGFVDSALPAGYAPFGIQSVANQIYVTYASKANPDDDDETDGPGLGVVDLFDADGNLLRRVATGGSLDAPWGIALAPADFGSFGNDLLIGNFGDGTIHAFDAATGEFVGTLADAEGHGIELPGLWGMAFGTGANSQPTNTLFFAAGINDEADGVYGRIDPPA